MHLCSFVFYVCGFHSVFPCRGCHGMCRGCHGICRGCHGMFDYDSVLVILCGFFTFTLHIMGGAAHAGWALMISNRNRTLWQGTPTYSRTYYEAIPVFSKTRIMEECNPTGTHGAAHTECTLTYDLRSQSISATPEIGVWGRDYPDSKVLILPWIAAST